MTTFGRGANGGAVMVTVALLASASCSAADSAPVVAPVAAPLPAPSSATVGVALQLLVTGLDRPVALATLPGDPEQRLFIVEQHVARIRIVQHGKLLERPFLSLSGKVSTSNEQGLLGLAFHPDALKNGRFFINYTDRRGDTHVEEYRVSAADPALAEPAPVKSWLTVHQPFANHNGGHLLFGPDRKLYIGLGDGGDANDPLGNGQRASVMLGKMLRLDVERGETKPEIWLIGLRNPWRYSFDRKTGDLYIGDVGQNKWEEIDVVPAAGPSNRNFGWNEMEGFHCFARRNCRSDAFALPVVDYPHEEGCSVTGGVVYRGKQLPQLDGVYFYADYCSAFIRSFRWGADGVKQHWDWTAALNPRRSIQQISSFGEDDAGELYVLSLAGSVYELVGKK